MRLPALALPFSYLSSAAPGLGVSPDLDEALAEPGNSAGVQVCPPNRSAIHAGPSTRPSVIALAARRFSLPPITELAGLEKIYAKACPDAVCALQEKIAALLNSDDLEQAERQAVSMTHCMEGLIGANALIALYEAIKLLRASARLTPDKIDALVARLQSLDTLYQERVPETIVSTLELNDALGVTFYPTSSADRLPDSVMGLPGLVLTALFHPYSLGESMDDKIFEPIGKQFGRNLNHLLTFLPPRRIELGAGRGLLSAVLNACVDESGIGRKMFYTSDKSQVIKPWPGIDKVFKLSAEKIIEKYRHSPLKEQIIYLCTSPSQEMIKGIISTCEPVLLLVASELYGARTVSLGSLENNDYINRQGLAIEPSKIGGGALLGLNITSADFAAITDRIPDRYKMDVD